MKSKLYIGLLVSAKTTLASNMRNLAESSNVKTCRLGRINSHYGI